MTRSADMPDHASDVDASGISELRSGSVTVSSVPVSRETTIAGSSAPSAWLDRVLVAACEMPVDEGDGAVVAFMVQRVGEIFPDCGVGACLVPPLSESFDRAPPSSVPALRAPRPMRPAEQQLFKYVPDGEERRGVGMDPTRLFPGFAFERVLEVPGGSTLHLASDDPQLEDNDSPMMHVARRAAFAMGRGLQLSRSHLKATADARELRALNSHMVQAEKLASLGQIAAGVVHELNNPLTSIVAYTDWLLRKQGASGDPDSVERLRRIGESASRILRFTRDLVAYARPSSEVPVPVSVHTVIEQALAFCEHVIAQHGAKVERRFTMDLPPVRGMHEQLVQVFVNLFTNACHALPKTGGQLGVSTQLEPDGHHLLVVVTDNGHGIAPEHVGHIFAPFFTTKVDGMGTGLGLSIVKNIMDNHGAEIRAESTPSGATFALVFPVKP